MGGEVDIPRTHRACWSDVIDPPTGHWPDRNPTVQRSPSPTWRAIIGLEAQRGRQPRRFRTIQGSAPFLLLLITVPVSLRCCVDDVSSGGVFTTASLGARSRTFESGF